MLKALVKKQFMELFQGYFKNVKTGKARSKAGTVGYFILMFLVFLFLMIVFGFISLSFVVALSEMNLKWLYFALMGLFTIMLGAFGSVFNTYNSLYLAKDNELLLSMPIEPKNILISRMISTYGMSVLYCSLVWLPTILIYWIFGEPTVLSIIFTILLSFIIPLFVTAITCALGWVLAFISKKLRRKNIVTVFLSLVFFVVYYYVCFQLNDLLTSVLAHSEEISRLIHGYLWPAYELGLAGTGEIVPMILVTLINVALFVLCVYVMSRSFIKIVTTTDVVKKVEYKETTVKEKSVDKALFQRELSRFLSSPTYMLNTGFGLVVEIVLAVVLVVRASYIREVIRGVLDELPQFGSLFCVIAALGVGLISATAMISTPSVALEGKQIWIVQSMPVNPWSVLRAKEKVHVYLNAVPAVLLSLSLSYVLQLDFVEVILVVAFAVIYIMFSADMGLFAGLRRPNLHWTTEVYPIKQDINGFIILFGGWIINLILGIIGFVISGKMEGYMFLVICIVVFSLLTRLIRRNLMTRGARKFSTLS